MSKIDNKPALVKWVNETKSDVISFLPPEDTKPGTPLVNFSMQHYTRKSAKLNGSPLGDSYDIILFQLDENRKVKNLYRFEAILIEPIQYVMRLIDDDFYGIIGKLTKNSRRYFDKLYNELT